MATQLQLKSRINSIARVAEHLPATAIGLCVSDTIPEYSENFQSIRYKLFSLQNYGTKWKLNSILCVVMVVDDVFRFSILY